MKLPQARKEIISKSVTLGLEVEHEASEFAALLLAGRRCLVSRHTEKALACNGQAWSYLLAENSGESKREEDVMERKLFFFLRVLFSRNTPQTFSTRVVVDSLLQLTLADCFFFGLLMYSIYLYLVVDR